MAKGRTLWEILTEKNKEEIKPLEFQHHNPLEAKIGTIIELQTEPDFTDINFFVNKIAVYKTQIGGNNFHHTDYCLKGFPRVKVGGNGRDAIYLRLRLVQDENVRNETGHKFQLLRPYDEFEWDEGFHEILTDDSQQFQVNHDKYGQELEQPELFFRCEDVFDPYEAKMTVLADEDKSGTVDEDELRHSNCVYWDYYNQNNEYLWVEMDAESGYFRLYRGHEISPNEISVI